MGLGSPVMTLPSALMSLCCTSQMQMMPFFKQAGEMTVAMGYQGLGLQKLLLCPPVDNPRSIVDFCLYVKYAQVRQQTGAAPIPARCRGMSQYSDLPHGMVHVWSGGEQGRRGAGKPVPQGATIALACIPICCIVQPHNQISGPAGLCAPAGACLSDKQRTHCL